MLAEAETDRRTREVLAAIDRVAELPARWFLCAEATHRAIAVASILLSIVIVPCVSDLVLLERDPFAVEAEGYTPSAVLLCIVELRYWFAAAVVFDVLAIWDSRNEFRGKKLWEHEAGSYLPLIFNFPFLMLFGVSLMDGLRSLLLQGFWLDLLGLSTALSLQIGLVVWVWGSEAPWKGHSRRTQILAAIVRGLISASGVALYSLGAFFVFHLLAASSLLSDESISLISNAAVAVRERLECPLCVERDAELWGLKAWELWILLFLLAGFVASGRLLAALRSVRRGFSVVEMAVLGFLCLSITAAACEELGIVSEVNLLDRAERRGHVARVLADVVRSDPLDVRARWVVREVDSKLKEVERPDDVLRAVVAEVLPVDVTRSKPPPPPPTDVAGLREIRERRRQVEHAAEADAQVVEEAVSGGISTALEPAVHLMVVQLLETALVDSVRDATEDVVKEVCARVLRTLTDRMPAGTAGPLQKIERLAERLRTTRQRRGNLFARAVEAVESKTEQKPSTDPTKPERRVDHPLPVHPLR